MSSRADVPPASPETVHAPPSARPDLRLLSLLGLGHMVVDINGGAIPALLPFLKSAYSLTYATSGVIVMVANVTSSLIQPFFGYLADRSSRRWLLPASVAVSTIGIAATGLSPSYAFVLGLIVITGLGNACYHPEGYRTATYVAGSKKATGVSIFSLGGNIGIALGPPLMTLLVGTFGLAGTLGMAIPGLLTAIWLALALPQFSSPVETQIHRVATDSGRTNMYGMVVLMIVVALRSWTQSGFSTFIPFYYTDVLHGDPRYVGTLLAVFLGAGALGTLVAGPVADRFGVRRFAVGVFLLASPLAGAFLMTSGLLSVIILAALGFVLVSTFTVTVVLGQAYMPRSTGMASGLIVGFATGAGGLGVTVLGKIADSWGLMSALWLSALMPLAAFGVSLLLPEPKRIESR